MFSNNSNVDYDCMIHFNFDRIQSYQGFTVYAKHQNNRAVLYYSVGRNIGIGSQVSMIVNYLRIGMSGVDQSFINRRNYVVGNRTVIYDVPVHLSGF